MMQVHLRPPVKIELVDEEIITLAGCDLGFIMPGKPPQVLQVEQGSDMAAHSIRTDDVLVGVDGRDTRNVSKEELQKILRSASNLTFERPKPDVDVDMAPKGDTEPSGKDVPAASAEVTKPAERPTEPEQPAEQPAPQPAQAAAAPGGGPELRTGMHVRLVGFQASGMNDAKGKLGKFSSKQGLWQVFLDSATASKAVKPANLEALANQPEGVATGDAPAAKRSNVVLPPPIGLTSSAAVIAAMAAAMRGHAAPHLPHFDGPGPPPGPEWQEDVVPVEDDKESWVELLRDAQVRQIRSDAEHAEPPPFNRAMHFSGMSLPGQPIAEGKFPAQALNFQLQLLLRTRQGDYGSIGSSPYGSQGWGHPGQWIPGGRRWGGGYGKGDWGKGGPGGSSGPPRSGGGGGAPRWVPTAPGGPPLPVGQQVSAPAAPEAAPS